MKKFLQIVKATLIAVIGTGFFSSCTVYLPGGGQAGGGWHQGGLQQQCGFPQRGGPQYGFPQRGGPQYGGYPPQFGGGRPPQYGGGYAQQHQTFIGSGHVQPGHGPAIMSYQGSSFQRPTPVGVVYR